MDSRIIHCSVTSTCHVYSDQAYLYCKTQWNRFTKARSLAFQDYYDGEKCILQWLVSVHSHPPDGYFSMLLIVMISVWIIFIQVIQGYFRIRTAVRHDTDVHSPEVTDILPSPITLATVNFA